MQIKTIIRYHLTPVRMSIKKKKKIKITSIDKELENWNACAMLAVTEKNIKFFKKLKIQ